MDISTSLPTLRSYDVGNTPSLYSVKWNTEHGLKEAIETRVQATTSQQERKLEADYRATCKDLQRWGQATQKLEVDADTYVLLKSMKERAQNVVEHFAAKGITLHPNDSVTVQWSDKNPSPLLRGQGIKKIVYTITHNNTKEKPEPLGGTPEYEVQVEALKAPDKRGRKQTALTFSTTVSTKEVVQRLYSDNISLYTSLEEKRDQNTSFSGSAPTERETTAPEYAAAIEFTNQVMERLGINGWLVRSEASK